MYGKCRYCNFQGHGHQISSHQRKVHYHTVTHLACSVEGCEYTARTSKEMVEHMAADVGAENGCVPKQEQVAL